MAKKNILERIKESPVIFDGPMGTMIYAKGVFINTCYDELSLKKPELISEIHNEYRAAGAEILETNTFGANRIKLTEFSLGDQVREINEAGVRLAREAAGEELYVAGAVGPCSKMTEVFDPARKEEYREAFAEQCSILAEAGVDLLQLETFTCLEELKLAAAEARKTGLTVSASFSVSEEGQTMDNRSAMDVTKELKTNPDIDIIGINCHVGPAAALEIVKQMVPLSSKPIIVMPNAGLPKEIGGRVMYLTSPEYFAKYAKRYIQAGVRGFGGCCGITPAHLEKAVKGVKNLSEVKKFKKVTAIQAADADASVRIVPLEEKSAFGAKLVKGEKVTLVEVLSSRTIDMSRVFEKVKTCHDNNIDAVNIPDGPRASARQSNILTGVRLQEETGIEVIPHFCCRDRNLLAMQGDLMAAFSAGIKNFLCVTGDPPNIGDYPDMTGVFDVDAIGLIQMVSNLNHGHDLAGHPIGEPSAIIAGCAANPCAVDMPREIDRFYRKIDAGAEYAITQPVFDAESLISFVEKVSSYKKTIPIIAGVWPLASLRNAEFMASEVPGVVVPVQVIEKMGTAKTKEDSRKMGIELARATCDKVSSYVQGFQVSAPLGRVDTALEVLG